MATSSFTTQALTADDNGKQVRVVWSNAAGQAVSQAVTITVQVAPVVTTNPSDVSALAGSTATFTAEASGSPTPSIQWQKSTDGGTTWGNISGATSSSYTTPTLEANTGFGTNNDGEKFRAVFTNAVGAVISSAATLTVSSVPSVSIVSDPEVSVDLDSSTTLSFYGNITGYPTPSVDWQVSTDDGASWSSTGQTGSNPIFSGLSESDDGNQYRGVATNRAGSDTSSAVTLTVYRVPAVTSHPSSSTINEGQTASLSASASGYPTPTVQWQTSTDSGSSWSNISGATSTTYTTPTLQYANDGVQYRAVFTNAYGTATTNAATIDVNDGPLVTSNPSDSTVLVGQTATFTASASGDPTPTVQWQLSTDGGSTFANISGATSTSYTTGTLSSADDGKKFRAVFTNVAGTSTTSAATLTVQQAPVIASHPSSTTSPSGVSVTFSASASGYPSPTVQWQLSTNSGSTWSNIGSATSTSYTTPTLATTDDGNQYRAVFTNAAGSATTNAATLTIQDLPVVTLQPIAVTVTAGETATFTSEATGYPTPTAEWEVSADDGSTWGPVTIDGNPAL